MTKLFLVSFLVFAQVSCGDLKISPPSGNGADDTDDSKDTVDAQLAQDISGYYEIEDGSAENIKFNSEGAFAKVEMLKAGSSQGNGCKFNMQGSFAIYKRHDDNRKKFWSDATHEIKARVSNVTLLNPSQLHPVEQQNCMNFQKREFTDNIKPVRYFLTPSMKSIRFYNSLGDKLTGGAESPVGVLYKKL